MPRSQRGTLEAGKPFSQNGVVGNAAESLMGFASTTTRVTGELAGAVQGQGNLAGAGLSTKFAQLGIDSSKLGNVRQASIAQAGAQNLQGQIDLLRSERNLGQRDMTKLGTFQGFGNGPLAGVPGLGWIGQTPGAIEQLVNNLKTPATEENVNNLVRTGVFTTEPSKATTDLQRFIDDQDAGAPEFAAMRAEAEQHQIEEVGRELRQLMAWVATDDDYTEGTAAR